MKPTEILRLQVAELERRLKLAEAREQQALDAAKDLRAERDRAVLRADGILRLVGPVPATLRDRPPMVAIAVSMVGPTGKVHRAMVELDERTIVLSRQPHSEIVRAGERALYACAQEIMK